MTDLYTRRLTPAFLFAEAFRTFRDRWPRVLLVGGVVSAFAIVTDSLLDDLVEHTDLSRPTSVLALVGVTVGVTASAGLGTTFLSGVLDRTVGEHQHGHEPETLAQLLRSIPYGRLILADLVAIVLKVAGFLLLLLPGLVAITLLCVVGPVVMVEGKGPFGAVRRSAQLVRPYFWLAFVAVTIPIIGESVLSDYVEGADWTHDLLMHLFVGVGIEAPVTIFVSLVEVTLAYHLIERDVPGRVSRFRGRPGSDSTAAP